MKERKKVMKEMFDNTSKKRIEEAKVKETIDVDQQNKKQKWEDLFLSTQKSKEEQEAIAQILTTADDEITELEKKLQIIEDQKKYLLNNLITGTIRTPETLSTKLTK